MTRRMIKMIFFFVLVVGLIGGYKAWQIHGMMKMFAAMKPPPTAVAVQSLAMQSWRPEILAVGTLRARHGVSISTEVGGLLSQVAVHSGQSVHRGQLLFALETMSERATLAQLQAAVHLAEITRQRDLAQLPSHAVAQAQVDADTADLAIKRAQVQEEQALIAKKELRAPFSGRVGIVTANPGQYVNPGDVLASLQSQAEMLVDFPVPQEQGSLLHIGGDLTLHSDSQPQHRFSARISAIDATIDKVTRSIQVEAMVQNGSALVPGSFAKLQVDAGQARQVMTLPQTAVTYNPYGDVVFLLQHSDGQQGSQGTVEQVFVKLGQTRGDQVEVLDGIQPGQWVVTAGGQLLKNGSKVVVDNRHAPTMSAHPDTPNDE